MTLALYSDPVPLLANDFGRDGWIGPVDLLTDRETKILRSYIKSADRPAPVAWEKGFAVTDRIIYELASDPRIKCLLDPLLGEAYFIWGACVVERAPGERHSWHTDIESAASDGNVATIWIPLENGSAKSSLCFISGSQKFGQSIQQASAAAGLKRDSCTATNSFQLAQTISQDCTLVQPIIKDGQALIFDGRIWHGSLNQEESGTRRTLLLQYSRPDFKIRIPAGQKPDWPFVFRSFPKPPVIMISGEKSGQMNKFVTPPPKSSLAVRRLKNLVKRIPQPLERNIKSGWQPTHFYVGSTPVLRKISCHASVLEPGKSPHAPHSHFDEEILTILDGEAELVIAESEYDPDPRIVRMAAGDFVYYPSSTYHTIRCIGDKPVSYFMYRWNAGLKSKSNPIDVTICRKNNDLKFDPDRLFSTSVVLEGATDLLSKLHIHYSRVCKKGGYAAHRDAHDVAILLLQGSVRTLGRTVRAPAVLLYPANCKHGMLGLGEEPALYQVVEFHGEHHSPPSRIAVTGWKIGSVMQYLKNGVRRRIIRLWREIRAHD